jgi:hypothetical protein
MLNPSVIYRRDQREPIKEPPNKALTAMPAATCLDAILSGGIAFYDVAWAATEHLAQYPNSGDVE